MAHLPSRLERDIPAALNLQPDASELVVGTSDRYICETYIFDPVSEEESLGRLFAVAETEDRGGIGSELLDLTIQALQREYYRDPSRGILASFESALHQANLVLHDTAEQGVRDWMGYFHVAVGVLARETLHISTAGDATILLVRRSRVTTLSTDLSHSPITNPLRTFAQVASGTLTARDVLFLGTSHVNNLFRYDELARLAIDHSASAMSTRLAQLYHDKKHAVPLAMLTISILPQHIVQPRREVEYADLSARRPNRQPATTLSPRKPIVIHRSWLKTILLFGARMVAEGWGRFKTSVWPLLLRSSRSGGKMLAQASITTGKNVQALTSQQLRKWRGRPSLTAAYGNTPEATAPRRAFPLQFSPPRVPSLGTVKQTPLRLVRATRIWLSGLPRSSRIFAAITGLLAIALIVSIVLLQHKRAEETVIQRASEILHDARNSKNAAEDALIYDNREQARTLLAQAQNNADELAATGLYVAEVKALKTDLQTVSDRLQRIVRTSTSSTQVIGDFSSVVTGAAPAHLALVNNSLYTFNPENNTVIAMTTEGTVAVATQSTEGIGFFKALATHPADKQIILATDTPGIAMFDAKDNTMVTQDIAFPAGEAQILSLATYGSRLYVYDKVSGNILSFTKTLRGYTGGTSWITASDFPASSILSIGVDGNIYTLHSDGTIRKLLKGEPVAFTAESVDPPLRSATKLFKSEDLSHLYVLDTTNKRVVIFDTTGKLVRQLFLDVATELRDIAIAPDEKTLYALDNKRVLSVALEP